MMEVQEHCIFQKFIIIKKSVDKARELHTLFGSSLNKAYTSVKRVNNINSLLLNKLQMVIKYSIYSK